MASFMVGDVGGEVESGDIVEVELEVGGQISSRDDRSISKDVKIGVGFRKYYIVD